MRRAASRKTFVSAVLLASVGVASAQATPQVYAGLCDASAAVAIGPRHFAVGDDETDVLVLYEAGRPESVGRLDVVDFLGNRSKKGKPKEGDIEGAARVDGRIYWITSHGRDSGGDYEPTRHRLFATEIGGEAAAPTLRPVGSPYKTLLEDILAEPRFAGLGLVEASKRAPEDRDGLGIEGLAATPEGGLLIGFRNPLPESRAIVIPLLNPAEVVDKGAKPRLGEARRLDLGGRGIRSIERWGAGYLVVAGPYGERDTAPPPPFALYRWDGGEDPPARLGPSLPGSPEALFLLGSDRAMLLSDDGDEPVDGRKCKSRDTPMGRKSFRAVTLSPGGLR